MSLGDEKYVLLTTFKRNGTPVATPVWSVPLEGESFGFWTSSGSGKGKRLAHTSKVVVQPCDSRGNVNDGTEPVDATARTVTDGAEMSEIQRKVKEKYGFMTTLTKVLAKIGGVVKRNPIPYGDLGVIVTPD